ncbi:P-loop containing nucleoside triphosphate hydrolase protein, partial [Elsinoe ampelina]
MVINGNQPPQANEETKEQSQGYAVTPNTTCTGETTKLPRTKHRHVWYVTGPAGCGKTTVASYMAGRFSMPYLEGDTFHPPANISKMAAGYPLTDSDRWDWLARVRDAAVSTLSSRPHNHLVTCSALKHSYRDMLRSVPASSGIKVHFVYLALSEEVLFRRVRERVGHYMKESMVRSQIEVLEEPGEGE